MGASGRKKARKYTSPHSSRLFPKRERPGSIRPIPAQTKGLNPHCVKTCLCEVFSECAFLPYLSLSSFFVSSITQPPAFGKHFCAGRAGVCSSSGKPARPTVRFTGSTALPELPFCLLKLLFCRLALDQIFQAKSGAARRRKARIFPFPCPGTKGKPADAKASAGFLVTRPGIEPGLPP